MLEIVILAAIAGFFSSVLGGVIAISFRIPSKKFIGLSFVFTSSVLLTLVFVDFIPHAIGHGHYHTGIDAITGHLYQYWHQHSGAGIWLTILGLAIGIGLVTALSYFDKYGHEHIHGILSHSDDCSHGHILTDREKKRMIVAAFPIAFAIILHDFPKGLAIGSAGSVLAAVMIGLSCIPEGMTIAIPLKAGGLKWWKILSFCGIAGIATVLGAIVGYMLGGINVYFSGILFAVAAGCVIGVVFTEIMPLAMEYTERSRLKLLVSFTGVALVLTLNYFFHDLMH